MGSIQLNNSLHALRCNAGVMRTLNEDVMTDNDIMIFNTCRALCPCRRYSEDDDVIKHVIDQEYRMLGRIT